MKNFDIKTAVCIVLIAAFAACGFLFVVKPQMDEYIRLEGELKNVNQQLDPELLTSQEAQARYELETARKKAGDNAGVFYHQMSDGEFNSLLRRLLSRQLLTLNSLVLTPYVPVKNGNVALLADSNVPLSPDAPDALLRRTAEMEITGEYASILAFIDSVNQLDICFGIDSAKLLPVDEPENAAPAKPVKGQPSPSPIPGTYKADITLRLYSIVAAEEAAAD